MQNTATPSIHTSTDYARSANRSTATFTKRFAIGAAIFYTLLFAAAVVALPELIGSLVAWTLWVIVMVASAVSYAAGQYMKNESKGIGHSASALQSHRMRHWLKSR
jgi:glucan phosphoethanolaminetransferase (alkaline phosphatase superfamily)